MLATMILRIMFNQEINVKLVLLIVELAIITFVYFVWLAIIILKATVQLHVLLLISATMEFAHLVRLVV